jgi:hypothetical protein
MASFATLLALGSTALTTVGTIAEGRTEAAARDANAAALREKGKQEFAAATVRAERRMRDAEALRSMQQAEAAHSGGGVGGSAGVIMGETARKGLLNSNLEVWEGRQRRSGYEDQANIEEWNAGRVRAATPIRAGAALLTGLSRAYGGIGASAGSTGPGSDVIDDRYDPASGWRTTTRRGSGLYYG